MTISGGDHYYCSGRREKGTCDADRGIAAHELEQRVLKGLKENAPRQRGARRRIRG
jgi:hypothetical protein